MTTTQPDLFSAPADAKRHTIQQADVHADTQWREAAYAALRDVASTGRDFTADDCLPDGSYA